MHDIVLIPKRFTGFPLVNEIQHRRSRAIVKRYEFTYKTATATLHSILSHTTLFYVLVSNHAMRTLGEYHIRKKSASRKYCW